MTTQTEALKLALDALENHTAIKHPQQIHYRDKAITAIKEALAQPEQEPVYKVTVVDDQHPDGIPLEQWWQQPEQEPFGFAGVKIWIGNQQVVRILTQTELHHAIEPWLLVELNAEMCIKKLKENA